MLRKHFSFFILLIINLGLEVKMDKNYLDILKSQTNTSDKQTQNYSTLNKTKKMMKKNYFKLLIKVN